MRIIIVEDEKRVRNALINVLKLHYPKATIVGEATDVTSGIQHIKTLNPDVVLLDIKLPGGSGFDILKQLKPFTFNVIFITAFDQYAVQAFKFSAIDYLLKPVVPEEFVDALQRAEQKLNTENSSTKFDVFMSNLNGLARETKKIVLNSHDKIQVVSLNEVIRCEADRNYTLFVITNKKSILVSKPLKDYDDMLKSYGFFRSHHSHLVNLSFIDRLEKRNGGTLIMKDGSEVLVSSRKQAELVDALNSI